MRMWAKMFMDSPPPKPITQKDKILSLVSIIVDASIIGLLVYTLFVNSCQICFSTQTGINTYKTCSNIANIMDDGMPSEMQQVYSGQTSNQLFINQSPIQKISELEIQTIEP